MFKILPTAKRAAPSDIKDPLTSPSKGKENSRPGSFPQIAQRSPSKPTFPDAPHSYDGRKASLHPQTVRPPDRNVHPPSLTTDRDFEKMLDDLQIPTTLRPKLATLESPVKAAMLRSSHVLTTTDPVPLPGAPRKKLRRSLSSTNLDSPRANALAYNFPCPPQSPSADMDAPLMAPLAPFMLEGSGRSSSSLGHSRGVSLDLPRSTSQNFATTKSATSKSSKAAVKDLSPAALCTMLTDTSSTQLEVEIVKKLRMMLRNESTSWSGSFLRQGGYAVLLTRLMEILEVEWREEQHDDQILHELLRCFKALSTSSIGCFALRSSCPTPFAQLVSLLYSDKKPGDLCTRQLIIDLLQILFDIYPAVPGTTVGQNVRQRREAWEQAMNHSGSPTHSAIALPLPHTSLYALVRALLLTPPPPPTEPPSTKISPHAFIESLHLPRIFKAYLRELSDLCRDYFWVFCHPQNSIWNLEQTDEAKVERPRAPGGMTGGVEFEAMGYLTSHFHLINSLATAAQDLNLPADNEHSAHRLHADLFASGIERVILTTRKASTTYYPTLHLEIARYLALAGRARFEIPWTLSRLVGPPPTAMIRGAMKSRGGSPRTSPTKSRAIPAGAAPSIPTPTKVEPIKF